MVRCVMYMYLLFMNLQNISHPMAGLKNSIIDRSPNWKLIKVLMVSVVPPSVLVQQLIASGK